MPQSVLIVSEGSFGAMKPGDYDEFIETCRNVLEEEITGPSGSTEQLATVEIVTLAEAEDKIKAGGVDVLVFATRGLEKEAERIAAQYPKVKVVVFTGLIPGGTIVWVSKSWIRQIVDIRRHVLE